MDTLIDTLNALIETSRDGERAYQDAADQVVSPALQRLLRQRAEDCAQAAAALQLLVLQEGARAADRGTVAGALQRGWSQVRGTLAGRTDLSILEEIERGAAATLRQYADALGRGLHRDVQAVLQRQYDEVQRHHTQLRVIRDRARTMGAG